MVVYPYHICVLCERTFFRLMKKYEHLFFDLDRTLWDFDTNSRLALNEIYLSFNLRSKGIMGVEEFVETYQKNNEE